MRGGLELRPLAGPAIPVPAEQEEAFIARYEAWQAETGGSIPEFIVWEFLTIQKKQVPGMDFYFQAPFMGGRTIFGGFVADFMFPNRREVWQVQGIRWHLEQPADRAKTAIAEAQLTEQGYKVLELWEDDLLERPDFVLNLAWERSQDVPERKQ